jgi:rubrerythrin
MDVFEFALKMELDGKAYYEKLAGETAIRGFKVIFSRLAEDEQKHYDTVKAISQGTDVSMAETTVLDGAKNVFQEMIGDEQLLGGMKENLQAYEHAKNVEADSIRLYEDLATKESNPQIAALLRRIADEEKKHYNIMENLYDMALRPKYYLEWREFSNLGQL